MTLGILLGMAMLTLYFGYFEEQQRNPNASPQSLVRQNSIEVALLQNRQGHYVVTGAINKQPVEFLLDTGATAVVVPAETARRLALKYGRRSQAMTANGPINVWQTTINELTIGDIQLRGIDASINPNMAPGAVLLGMSALSQIEFVQQGQTLTLRQNSPF